MTEIRFTSIATILILVVFVAEIDAQQGPSGFDLYVGACKNQGSNPKLIWSGYAELEFEGLPKSDTEIEHEIADQKAALRQIIESEKDPYVRGLNEELYANISDNLRAQKGEGPKSHIKVLFDGNDFAGRFRASIDIYNWARKQWSGPVIALRRNGTKDSGENVTWTSSSRQATLYSTNFAMPADFQLFGRMQGASSKFTTAAMLDRADLKNFSFSQNAIEKMRAEVLQLGVKGEVEAYVISGEETYDKNAVASIVDCRVKGEPKKLLQRYWIDASRGYICPLVQFFDKDSHNIITEAKASDYFLHAESGLWYPERYSFTQFDTQTQRILDQKIFRTDKSTFWFNKPVADEQFSISIFKGATVLDARDLNNQIRYKANEKFGFSFEPGGMDLSKKPLTQLDGRIVPKTDVSHRFWTLVLAGVFFALLAICIWLRKRWPRLPRQTRLSFLSAAVVLIHNSGCEDRAHLARASSAQLTLEPKVLNFGNVRESSTPLELRFDVVNNGAEQVEIEQISAGCGCTSTAVKRAILQPGMSLTVPISVRLEGRVGPFSSHISLKTSSSIGTLTLPIKGEVITDLWSDQASISCAVDERTNTAGGQFKVYTRNWPAVKFDWSGTSDLVTITDTGPPTTNQDVTTLTFDFSVDVRRVKSFPFSANLQLKPSDPVLKALSIPLTCYLARVDYLSTTAGSGRKLTPEMIALGVIHPSVTTEFRVFGPSDVLQSLTISRISGLPKEFEIALLEVATSDRSQRVFSVRVPESVPAGFFEGLIVLTSSSGDAEFRIPIMGRIK